MNSYFCLFLSVLFFTNINSVSSATTFRLGKPICAGTELYYHSLTEAVQSGASCAHEIGRGIIGGTGYGGLVVGYTPGGTSRIDTGPSGFKYYYRAYGTLERVLNGEDNPLAVQADIWIGEGESTGEGKAGNQNFTPNENRACPLSSNPINLVNWNKFKKQVDFSSNTNSLLSFSRYYNSFDYKNGDLGLAWRHTYNRSLQIKSSGKHVEVHREDGTVINFSDYLGTGFKATENVMTRLIKSNTGYQFKTLNIVEDYSLDGRLIQIKNVNGRVISLDYVNGELSVVSDDIGNSLNFYFTSGLLDRIVLSDGREWNYKYNAVNRLETVINPDGTTRQYLYESTRKPTFLTSIIDERGIESEHYSYEYNPYGLPITSYLGLEGENISLVKSYYISGGAKAVENSLGAITKYTYVDYLDNKLIASVEGPGCAGCNSSGSESYTYDSAANVTSAKKNGILTSYSNYNANGNYGIKDVAVGTPEEKQYAYVYDNRFNGKVTKKTEPSVYPGSTKITTSTYDAYGNVTELTVKGFTPSGSPVSRTINFLYLGPLNQISQIDGPRTDVQDITTIDYYSNDSSQGNNRARVQRITTGGLITRDNIQYTTTGKVASEQRANGVSHTYQYYAGNDRLQTLTQSDGSISTTTQWAYLATGEVQTITRNVGTVAASTITFGYDAARRLTSITDSNGNSIVYTLDTEGNRTNEEVYDNASQLKRSITQTFDLYNKLDVNNQANETVNYNYLPNGTLDTVIDGNNVTTNYSYDALKRLTATTQDLGGSDPATENAISTYGYDSQGNLTNVTDPVNANTTYAYDDLGNLLQQTSSDTGATTFTYDFAGNVLTRIDTKSQIFTYQYDALNRIIFLDAPGATDDVSYVYDTCTMGAGRLCSITKGTSVNSYTYNAFGDVTNHQDIQYTYDVPGRLKTITYPSGNSVIYYYDTLGQVSKVDASINGTLQTIANNIRYAPFGPITALTYGNGGQLIQTFDTAYRITSQSIPSIFERNYVLYDGNGNLNTMNDLLSSSSDVFNFDNLNRIVNAAGTYGTQSFDYDKNGNRTGLTDKATSTINSYQPLSNRLTQVGSNAITLDANGNTLNDGKYAYGFDTLNRLISVDTDQAIYQYNGLGQRISKQTGGTAGPDYTALALEAQVEADLFNQQAATAQQQANDAAAQAGQLETEAASLTLQAQQYRANADALQVQISELATQQTQQVQLASQLQASADNYRSLVVEPPTNFIQRLLNPIYSLVANYFQGQANIVKADADAIGQQINTLQTQIAPLNVQALQFEQNVTALLTQASALRSQSTALQTQSDNLIQQANASKVKADEYTQLAQNPQSSNISYQYSYNLSGQLLIENKEGMIDSEYVYLNGQPLAVLRQSNVYYIHTDNLGTPRAVSDSSQTTVWRWNSDAFGSTAANEDPDGDGTLFTLNLRFPGQYYDAETGLHYNYFRDYDPSTGRYVQSDPIGLDGGLNTYLYAEANPLFYIDPDGLRPTRDPKGPDGKPIERDCMTGCIADAAGSTLLAAGGGLAFGYIAGGSMAAGVTGYFGASANAIYGNFNLAKCLDECDEKDENCKK